MSQNQPLPASRWPRAPRYIPWQRSMSGNSCIAAEVLYVYGRANSPDPYSIDRALRWRPPQVMSDFNISCYLMDQGFGCKFYTSDSDEALIEDGLDHIRRLYGTEWNGNHARYFTPKRIAQLQREAQDAIQRKASYVGTYEEVGRDATVEDVSRHLRQGHVVSFMSLDRQGKVRQRKCLLVPRDATSAWLYRVDMDGALLRPSQGNVQDMLSMIRFAAPVIAFWPR